MWGSEGVKRSEGLLVVGGVFCCYMWRSVEG
jgi:hypothetical protein